MIRLASAVDVPRVEASDQALLHQKLTELDRLRAEIEQLRALTGTPQTMLVNVELLEINLTRLRQLDANILEGAPDSVSMTGLADDLAAGAAAQVKLLDGPGVEKFISTVKRNHIARTVAEPFLMVTEGKPAALFIGGEVAIPAAGEAEAEAVEVGTQLKVLAKSLGGDRVRLHLQPRLSAVGGGAVEVDGRLIPSLNVEEFDCFCEMSFGETVMFSVVVSERVEAVQRGNGPPEVQRNEIALCLVVRAEDTSEVERMRVGDVRVPAYNDVPQ